MTSASNSNSNNQIPTTTLDIPLPFTNSLATIPSTTAIQSVPSSIATNQSYGSSYPSSYIDPNLYNSQYYQQYYQQYYSQYGYGPQQTQAIGDYYAHQTSATSTIYPSTQASYLSTMMNAAAAAASTRVKSNSKNDSLGKDSSGNDHDDDDDDDPTIAKPNQPKLSNILNYSCNEKMGLNPLIYTNIQQSPYFKNNLFQLKTYNEVIDEIYYSVRHLEPWEKGSRKVSGQTGMCGSVRGVGAGGIISTPFCILYKLFTLKLTRKQVMAMTRHKDSPYIRSLGLMYIRFTQPSRDLWHWFEPYLEDDEQVDPKAGGGSPMTIGQMVRHFLTKLEWFSTLFPRIPRHDSHQRKQKRNHHQHLHVGRKRSRSRSPQSKSSSGKHHHHHYRKTNDNECNRHKGSRYS
ncbi:pre-mrna-splicing factor 38b isoform x1 [Dermatophagoides farinae]|uniref:Pre-mRNA-splicing factor 38 n=1 Tax=Dermatophagoides farinae TaxID=6954 RepID=A0A9D4SG58_DERFA|nr:pre-mrna-splicing factor 38b isoform x1 [Dermatophagoides farinae]